MNIQAGKQYVKRNGTISGVIETLPHKIYAFYDPNLNQSYTAQGARYSGGTDDSDLISEYGEPVVSDDRIDEFAGIALGAILTRETSELADVEWIVGKAYDYAEAMIAESKKRRGL